MNGEDYHNLVDEVSNAFSTVGGEPITFTPKPEYVNETDETSVGAINTTDRFKQPEANILVMAALGQHGLRIVGVEGNLIYWQDPSGEVSGQKRVQQSDLVNRQSAFPQ